LIIDDEPEIAEHMIDFLEGHELKCFTDPLKALDALASDHSIDMVISDYTMPGASGTKICSAAKQSNPTCFTLLITGLVHDSLYKDTTVDRVLSKPFSYFQIQKLVSSVAEKNNRNKEK
jgi:CheY-like chemotaxis protein